MLSWWFEICAPSVVLHCSYEPMSLHSSATIEVSDTGTISEADWEKAVSLAKRVVREDLAQQATKLRDRANQFLLEIGPLSEDEEGDSETAS